MEQLRRIRDHVFTNLARDTEDGWQVRYRFLEDVGQPRQMSNGIEAWPEPRLLVRFVIARRGQKVRDLDVHFRRDEGGDPGSMSDEVLFQKLSEARLALEEYLVNLPIGTSAGNQGGV